MTPSISFLIPTRVRHGVLEMVVDNLYGTADNPDRIEVLFKSDSDDGATIDTIGSIATKYPRITNIVTPRPPRAYQDIHQMYNMLAERAVGHFLWIFNDDAKLSTPGWDTVLERHVTHRPTVIRGLYPEFGGHNFHSNLFPIVNRPLFELQDSVLGLHSSIDVQYEILCSMVPNLEIFEPEIRIDHFGGMPSAHAQDGYPPFDPKMVHQYEGHIAHYARTIEEQYGPLQK